MSFRAAPGLGHLLLRYTLAREGVRMLTIQRKREITAELERVAKGAHADDGVTVLSALVLELLQHMPPTDHADAVERETMAGRRG